MKQIALITGIGGQDGHYLTDFLIGRGYDVFGLSRQRPPDLESRAGVTLVEGDVRDSEVISRIVRESSPAEVYNLAGPSFGPASWDQPAETGEALGVAVVHLLDAVRRSEHQIRMFQASSSELFGDSVEMPQTEITPFRPATPYALAKQYAHGMVSLYRRRYGVFACAGILFNHESPLRRPEFVTRKITLHAAMAKLDMVEELRLGNLDARRDWGFAGDYVEAMWMMLQDKEPDDYVVATGESRTVREFCEAAFEHVGLRYEDFVVQDPALYRRDDVERLGDPGKIQRRLGWKRRVGFREMIGLMVDADLARLKSGGVREVSP